VVSLRRMSGLEPRAVAITSLAVALALLGLAATAVLGVDVWNGVPTVGVLGALVATPGFVLGRTGLTTRPSTLAYEGALAAGAGSVVSLGVLVPATSAQLTGEHVLVDVAAVVAAVTVGWATFGVVGYAAGMASTLVR